MLTSFIFCYSEILVVLFYPTFFFTFWRDASVRDSTTLTYHAHGDE